MDKVEEDEQYNGAEKLFKVGESKDRGLADLEVGSACYLSEMLNFNFDEYDDCEEVKEDDLILLNEALVKQDLKAYLIKSLNELIVRNKEYFMACYTYLLKQDQQLAKKYLSFK